MMSDTPITERQQYWLDHIRAAEAFDGSVADYARSEGLKPKELYSWKGILARRGLLSVPAADENSGGFVRVIAPARPMGMSLVLPNGVRLEWHGDLGSEQFEALVLTASRLQ
jgi:hypothetical protein